MVKILKKVIDTVTTVFVVIALILAFLLSGIRLAGFEIFTVLSGSMEPAYHTGSVIYVKEVDCTRLSAGDVITFSIGGGTIATHRIVEVIPDENNSSVLNFRTKGDANEVVDGNLVNSADVIGSPVFTIPYLGFFAAYIQAPPGMYMVFALTAFVLLLSLLTSMLPDKKKNKR